MRQVFRRSKLERGATLIEYVLLAALIALTAMPTIQGMTSSVERGLAGALAPLAGHDSTGFGSSAPPPRGKGLNDGDFGN